MLNATHKNVFVCAILGVPESSPKSKLRDLHKNAQKVAFEVELNSALGVTIELHLKISMLMHLLKHKSARNNSTKTELQGTLYIEFEGTPKITL